MATGGSGISVTFSADDRDLLASYQKQQAEILKNQRALLKMSRTGEQAGRSMKRSADDSGRSWVAFAAKVHIAERAIALVAKGVQAAVRENQRFAKSVDEIARKGAETELKFQIQAGLTPTQVRNRIPQIKAATLRTPSADLFQAIDISTQLVSSGFKDEDIKSGAALSTVLDLKAATNQFGQEFDDPKTAVKSIAQFLKAQGIANPTAEQIRSTGGRLTTLFEGSDIQFPDLGDLAGQASVLKERGLSQIEQLAAFSTIRDVKDSPEAATGLRQVVSRLASAGVSPAKVQALQQIGLTPQDIDLTGENFVTALKRLQKGFAGVAPEERNKLGTILFGEKGEAAAGALLGAIPTIEKRIALQQDDATFERNVQLFQRSRFARQQRAKLSEQFAVRQFDEETGSLTFEETRAFGRARAAQIRTALRKRGGFLNKTAAAAVGFFHGVGDLELSAAEALGFAPGDFGITDPTKVSPETRRRIGDDAADKVEAAIHTLIEIERERQNNPQKVEVVNDPVNERGKANRKPPAADNNR